MRDKFGTDWELKSNSETLEEEVRDSVWIGWNHSIWTCEVRSKTDQLIYGHFCDLGGLELHVIVVYGKRTKDGREEMWEEILTIRRSIEGGLWVILDDFNDTRGSGDKDKGAECDEVGAA